MGWTDGGGGWIGGGTYCVCEELVVDEWETEGIGNDDYYAFGLGAGWWVGDVGLTTMEVQNCTAWFCIDVDGASEAIWAGHGCAVIGDLMAITMDSFTAGCVEAMTG